jgi:uncharacterized protein (DUF362 family)
LTEIKNTVERLFLLLGGLDDMIRPGSRIMLKPNIGVIASPEEALNTDPSVISAVMEILKDAGFKNMILAESSVVGTDTSAAFRKMGIDRICRFYGVGLVDLKKGKTVVKKVPNPVVLDEIEVFGDVDEADVIINIPKLKTICSCKISIGMKNLKGLIPDNMKKKFHHTGLESSIVDLNSLIKPALTLVDGVMSSQLYRPLETDFLAAGTDNMSADIVTSVITGIDPEEIGYFKKARDAGMGSIDIDDIEVAGDDIGKFDIKLALAPETTSSFAHMFPGVEIEDNGTCTGCVSALYRLLSSMSGKGMIGLVKGKKIIIGKSPNDVNEKGLIRLGNCALTGKSDSGNGVGIKGCPFISVEVIEQIKSMNNL